MISSGLRLPVVAGAAEATAPKRRKRAILRILYLRLTYILSKQFLRNGEQLNVACAFVDAADLRVAIEFFDGIVLRDPNAAVDFDGFRGDLFRDFRGVILRHCSFFYKRGACIAKTCGVVHEEARGFELSGHAGEIELDALEFRDGFAELTALPGVFRGMVEGSAGKTDHLCADGNTAFVQSFDCDFVAFADFAQDVRFGDFAIVEDEFAGGRGANAELVFMAADAEAGEISLDEECGDAAISGGGIDGGEENEDARFGGIADPELAAVDQEFAILAAGGGGESEGVRPGAGFGE